MTPELEWSEVIPHGYPPVTAAWSARYSHTSVTHNGFVWVMGGFGGGDPGTELNDVWKSADAETWSCVTPAAGWSARTRHALVSHNGYLWVLGGRDSDHNFKNDVWRSEDGEVWEEVTPAAGWSPRGELVVVSFAGYMWVLGGYDGTATPLPGRRDVWRSEDGETWEEVTLSAGWSWKTLSDTSNSR